MQLAPIIKVDEEKCTNCYQCVACPVDFCNNATGDHVFVNSELCIGCGQCIKACTHDARIGLDDFHEWMMNLKSRTQMVAVIAPAVASNFPTQYLNFNGWLKSIGVRAVFDVSFGAELTVKSYLEHVKADSPSCVIAQPCPALVSYVEIYKPELLQHLAPADSPMMHTIKMMKKYYPQYSNSKVVIISPCLAKKREFEESKVTIESSDGTQQIARTAEELNKLNENLQQLIINFKVDTDKSNYSIRTNGFLIQK